MQFSELNFPHKQRRGGQLNIVDSVPPWDHAVHAVLHGMSFRTAENTFPGVNREALRRRVHGVVDMHMKNGGGTYLTVGHRESWRLLLLALIWNFVLKSQKPAILFDCVRRLINRVETFLQNF